MKILVRCPNWVGDIVMATPIFEKLRDFFKDRDIKLIGCVRKYAYGVLEGSDWFNEIISINDKNKKGFIEAVKLIRKHRINSAILFTNSFRSALLVKLSGIKNIYGYKRDGRNFLITDGPIPLKDKNNKIIPIPMIEYYIKIIEHLNIPRPTNIHPILYISKEIKEKGEYLLKEKYKIKDKDILIGLNPGAKFGSSKCWSPEYFAKLSQLIKNYYKDKVKIILFVGPGEEELANKIEMYAKNIIINTAQDKIDLALLKPLIKRCNLLITNDTGPRHYAVAFDVPVIVIIGPTDERYTNANLEKTKLIKYDVPCRPCHKKICPYDHSCMKKITPDMVFNSVKEIIKI